MARADSALAHLPFWVGSHGSTALLALPGPLVLLPLAIGSWQILVLVAGAALRLARPRRRWRLAALPIVVSLGFLLGEIWGAVFGAVGLLAWSRPKRWLPVLTVLIIGSLVHSWLHPLPGVLPPLPQAPRPVAPIPAARLASLRAGRAVLLEVGEAEEYSNCQFPQGYLVRPADLDSLRDELAALVRSGPVVAVVPERLGAAQVAELRSLGVEVHPPISGQSDGAVCYKPIAAEFWMLTRWLVNTGKVPDVPGADFQGVPRIRSIDALAAGVPLIDADRIVVMPTAMIRPSSEPILIVGDSLALTAAAARLWRTAGGTVLATVPPDVLPRTSRGFPLGLVGFGLAASCLAAVGSERSFRRLRERIWRSYLTGRRTSRGVFLAMPPAALSFVLGVLAAWLVGQVPLPRSLWLLATPTAWGGPVWLGPALLLAITALAWVRFGRRPVILLILGALTALAALGVVTGPAPLPLHLAAFLLVWLAPFIESRLRRKSANLIELVDLVDADRHPWTGNKAQRLAPAVRRGLPVPPGIVVRPVSDMHGLALRVAGRFSGAPLLLRSSAPDEDDDPSTAGQYLTQRWVPDEGLAALALRIEEVAVACRGAVLVMPRVAADAAGVMAVDVAEGRVALVEEATGTDGVTAGSHQTVRYWIGARSGAVRVEGSGGLTRPYIKQLVDAVQACGAGGGEWLLRGKQWLLVQLRPPGDAPPAPPVPDGAGEALAMLDDFDQLVLADGETLPDPARRGTLDLWARRWRRDDALGDAYALLGLPRWLAPRQAVVPLGGRMYSSGAAMRRIQLVPILPGSIKRAARAIMRFSRQTERSDPEAELRRLAALSIALRITQLALPSRSSSPPPLPSQQYAADLEAGRTERWAHRAPFDLDPTSSRLGRAIPLPPPLPPFRAKTLDADTANLWRDLLLDRMAREVARLAQARTDWGPLPTVPATLDRYSIAALEGCEGEGQGRPEGHGGVWVSGRGPIEGAVSSVPRPGTIWALPQATPDHAGRWAGCVAVLSTRGGMLSHLAMVARAEGMPALFSVAELPDEGRLVRLEEDGRVTLL